MTPAESVRLVSHYNDDGEVDADDVRQDKEVH